VEHGEELFFSIRPFSFDGAFFVSGWWDGLAGFFKFQAEMRRDAFFKNGKFHDSVAGGDAPDFVVVMMVVVVMVVTVFVVVMVMTVIVVVIMVMVTVTMAMIMVVVTVAVMMMVVT
jgi:hypothetical protein